MKLFSVLIANYNNAHFLNQAIESVIVQTYANWEIVVVDDGSTDNSFSIYEEYKNNNKIRIHYNEKNKGIGFTKRLLCDLANGDLLAFLDSDDALHPDALNEMVKAHNSNPESSLICSRFYLCDENLKVITKSNYCIPIPIGETAINFPPSKVASHFAVFKSRCYKLTSGISLEYPLSEDMDLYYKLEETGKITLIDKHLYYYRNHNGSVSQNDDKAFNAFVYNIKAKLDACERRGIDPIVVLNKAIPNFLKITRNYEESIDYKIGKTLLIPIRFLLKLIGFYKQK
jgi:glycosyltransferase involved in cell wall biosynthesis